ncbi:hypothetical protein F4779DRAFT_635669 [Xylariaceae sp. FL0662B]|nr:hypothetical protein F4779DRAFT_635669 [Xylariaceae sp. FL0662B]
MPERVTLIMNATLYRDLIPITYGIEWQFLVPVLIQGQRDPHPRDSRNVTVCANNDYLTITQAARDAVADVLKNKAKVPITMPSVVPPELRALGIVADSDRTIVPWSRFVVDVDQALVPENDPFSKTYNWVGIKVKSNKRNTSLPDHFDQIGNVAIALRNTLRIRLAPTTSLMVHIGEDRRERREYESGPRFIRVFCMLWWFLEPFLESLAHPSRATHPKCLPLRENSRLFHTRQEELTRNGLPDPEFEPLRQYMHQTFPYMLRGGRLEAEIESIWRSVDGKSLARKMSVLTTKNVRMRVTGAISQVPTWNTGSVGFHGFCRGALPENSRVHNDGDTSTIEFRTMESTLDPMAILNWLAVLVRLFDVSRRAVPADILAIIYKATSLYDILDLLRDLNLEEQAKYYSEKAVLDRIPVEESIDNLFVAPYS